MSFTATAAPGAVPRDGARPPTRSGVLAPPPGVAVSPVGASRLTATRRITVEPEVWTERPPGFPAQHPYVRKFWTAAIGSGAVADLMRLAVAAQRGRSLPLPTSLSLLSREGLVSWSRGRLLTGTFVPAVPNRHIRNMTPALRREHQRALVNLPTAS